ncbi:MAG: hypothetical protein HY400_07500 [Elusimicrobia bacterium]|nr:hypothetical protein [Elusimicrobiota bacterium]
MNRLTFLLFAFSVIFPSLIQAQDQSPSDENVAVQIDKDFKKLMQMKWRIIGPSGRKGSTPQHTKFNLAFTPYGRSGNSRFVSAAVEFPKNKRGTALSLGITSISYKDPVEVVDFRQGRVVDLTKRTGPDLAIKQRFFRAGYGSSNGRKGIFLEPFGSAGIIPFLVSSTRVKVKTDHLMKKVRAPAPYFSLGTTINFWNKVAVGVERRQFLLQGENNQKDPFTNFTVILTQDLLRDIGNIFKDD